MRKRVDVTHEILKRKVLTIPEVSEYLRVSRQTIYRMLKRGDIPAFRIGGDWRFNIEDLGHWIERNLRRASRGFLANSSKLLFSARLQSVAALWATRDNSNDALEILRSRAGLQLSAMRDLAEHHGLFKNLNETRKI